MTELRILRERLESLGEDLDSAADADIDGSAALVAVTTRITTYPTTAASFYCISQQITGTENEGNAPTYTADDGGTLTALNVGSAIPPNGTTLVVASVGGRWVFRYDGP